MITLVFCLSADALASETFTGRLEKKKGTWLLYVLRGPHDSQKGYLALRNLLASTKRSLRAGRAVSVEGSVFGPAGDCNSRWKCLRVKTLRPALSEDPLLEQATRDIQDRALPQAD